MDTRKVQQVGFSTLVVSLPRDWAKEAGLKRGDIITFKREDGSLKIIPGIEHEKKELVKCIVSADLCKEPRLLTRIITANYILGRDTIQIIWKGEPFSEHLEEIRSTVKRLTGLGIVEQTLKYVTLHNFIDPTKYSIYGMLRRNHVILSSMLTAAIQALTEQKIELAKEVLLMEDEADQLYWLIIRQIHLASQDKAIAKKIGVEDPLHLLGDRTVAKDLEEMADYSESIAKEILKILDLGCKPSNEIIKSIKKMSSSVQRISNEAIEAFFSRDARRANSVIEEVDTFDEFEKDLVEKILAHVEDLRAAISLRSIVRSLAQIAKYCNMIAEITINRAMEQVNEICKLEMEELK
ncbi:MAG: AbrB/MazE/SpoVT family DNA-binding domain-containing protein [archaeon]|nr:AbrB/MazE/SpoVT family DNA-binding domain-containing protein [archaeon]